MSAEAIIKSQARDTLKNNYPKAVTALLVVLLPYYIIDGSTTVISCIFSYFIAETTLRAILIYTLGYTFEILAFFFFSPIVNGYIRAYYNASYTGVMDMTDLYYYFDGDRYKKALSMNLNALLRLLLPAALLYIPLIIFEILSAQIGEPFYGSVPYIDIFFILSVISTMTLFIYSLRYFTAYTVSCDIDSLTVKQAFEYSMHIMKGRTGSMRKLVLSFTPWLLLCIFVLPALYVIPYLTQSICISAKWMTKATFEVN